MTSAGAQPATQTTAPTSQPATQAFERHVATLEGLADPRGACFGDDGLLHVVERQAHRVSTFTPEGKLVRRFGRLGARNGELAWPTGIACASGRLFVVDSGNARVQVFDASGRPLASFGAHGHGPAELHWPTAIAVDATRVAVADTGNHRVQVFDRDGKFLASLGDHGSGPGLLMRPRGVALLANGEIAVADTEGHRVQVFGPDSQPVRAWGTRGGRPGQLSRPTGLCLVDGRLHVTDAENHRIAVFEGDGRLVRTWGLHAVLPHEGKGRLHYPEAFAVDKARTLAAVVEPFEMRVQLFAPGPGVVDSSVERELLGYGLNSHFGTRCDVRGPLAAQVEMDGASIRLFDARERPPVELTRFGENGVSFGRLVEASGVTLDEDRRILVADGPGRRLHVFQHAHDAAAPLRYDPFLTRLVLALDFARLRAETPELQPLAVIEPVAVRRSRTGDLLVLDAANDAVIVLSKDYRYVTHWCEFGSAPGRLRGPTDLALSSDGERIVVVDAGNHRVQSFDTAGNVVSSWGRPGKSAGEFVEPFGVAIGPAGETCVTDRGCPRVQCFDGAGRLLRAWGPGDDGLLPAERMGPGGMNAPSGLAFGDDGRLLVMDHGNHRALLFAADGAFSEAYGARLFVLPTQGAPTQPPTAASAAPATRDADAK